MNKLKYPKRYATILEYDYDSFSILVKYDDDDSEERLKLRWRNGKGSCGSSRSKLRDGTFICDFLPGVRVKVYKDNEGRTKFRRVGR